MVVAAEIVFREKQAVGQVARALAGEAKVAMAVMV